MREKQKEIIYYKCVGCGYMITELQYRSVKFNYPCPRCRIYRLNDYDIVFFKM